MAPETNHIDAVIADLESWRDQIGVTIQTLQHFREKGPAVPSTAPSSTLRHGQIPGDAFFQMTVPDAAEKYLKTVKATREIPDIADALLKGGLKSSSKNFTDMTRTVISRDDRFVKVPDSGWGLAEWYPAMRKEKKSKSAPTVDSIPPAPAPAKADKRDAATVILDTMRQANSGAWTVSGLTEATGLKPNTVRGTVYRLSTEGKVAKNPHGEGYLPIT